MSVVLIGFMGSGKSRVGRELARLLSCPLLDLDARVEEAEGCAIPEMFQLHGEMRFRLLESQELERALKEDAVLSTGGGVVTQPLNRALLLSSGVPIVWLQAEPQVLAARIRSEPGARPLIDGDGLLDFEATVQRVRALMEERAPLYEKCATMRIETGEREPQEIAAEIAASL